MKKSFFKTHPRPISRLAPTPSGYLHDGNIYNFLLTWLFVRLNQGTLFLRIDDSDQARTRDIYIDYIFEVLNWMGIDYDKGPKNLNDFSTNYSQTHKTLFYKSFLEKLSPIYYCTCTRKEIQEENEDGIYSGKCRARKSRPQHEAYNIRLNIEKGSDFIVWKKDNTPSYQLISVIEDLSMNIDLIIRGYDLKESTQIQKVLATNLKEEKFEKIIFHHHPLVTDNLGQKVSKSNITSQKISFSEHERANILTGFAQFIGLSHPYKNFNTAQDLLNFVRNEF